MISTSACGDDPADVQGHAGEDGAAVAGNSGDTAGQASGGSAAGGEPSLAGMGAESAGGQATACGESGACEPPGSALCSDDCVEIATVACYDCEQASPCYEFSENCLAFEGAEQSLCYDVHECVNATGCGDGENTLTSCFCGELTTSECIEAPSSGAGSPSGPCAEIIRSSMGADATNSQVLTRYMSVAYPGGAAIARMTCDKVVPECLEVCGF